MAATNDSDSDEDIGYSAFSGDEMEYDFSYETGERFDIGFSINLGTPISGAEGVAKFAIDEHNKLKGTDIDLCKVVKCSMLRFRHVFMTFEAKESTTGHIKTYQSRVYMHPHLKKLELFREYCPEYYTN